MRIFFSFLVFTCLTLAAVPGAQAQHVFTADSLWNLPGVTITAPRHAASSRVAPVRISSIAAATIRASGSRTVSEVLDRSSSVFIRSYGTGLSTVSLRGTAPSQTLILLDGHRFSDPQLGQVDLSLLPGRFLESADISYGAGSSLFGSAAVGGVINLRTLSGTGDAPLLSLGSSFGRFGQANGDATLTAARGKSSVLVSAQYDRATDDFPYLDTSLFPADESLREGADREQMSALLSFRRRGERHTVSAGALVADADRGLPGPAGRTPAGERQWDNHKRLWGSLERPAGTGTLRLGTAAQHTSLRYLNPQILLDDTGRTTSIVTDAEWTGLVNRRLLVNPGVSVSFGTADHPSLSRPNEWTGAGFLGASWYLGPATLMPSVRLDAIRTGGEAWTVASTGRLGANLTVLPGLAQAKASVGTSFRAPTFNDRFWVPGGNPNLNPERSRTVDGGLLLTPGPLEIELSGFVVSTNDQIVWIPEGSIWTPENRDRVRSRGLEISLSGDPVRTRRHTLSTGLVYSLVDARDRSDEGSVTFDKPLRYVPRHQAKGHIETRWRRMQGAVFARWVSERFVTVDASQGVDPYVVVDGRLAFTQPLASVHTEIALLLENILDAEYEVIRDYPMPPRRLTLQIRVSIN